MTAALAFTDEIRALTAPHYERVRSVIPEIEWGVHAPYVAAINRRKKERNAVILAHNYMTPEIYHCVADIVGDSLALAREATKTDADVIVLAGGALHGRDREDSEPRENSFDARPARWVFLSGIFNR